MEVIPYTQEAYALLHNGAVALAEVECNGIAVDIPYVHKAIAKTNKVVAAGEAELAEHPVGKEWRKHYRNRVNYDSTQQLSHILFAVMQLPEPKKKTAGGEISADEETLLDVADPVAAEFCEEYLKVKKLKKAVGTYLTAIIRESVDGLVHPFYNLHNAVSFRSSCDAPNLQNIPVRDPAIMELVRRAFVARSGNRRLVEIDFTGAEVRIGACYHKDPVMVNYILDKRTDMHRDMAVELFKAPADNISKPMRQASKGSFVFAEFYGDWYMSCADRLWKFAKDPANKTAEGVQLLDHLAAQGITRLGAGNPKERTVPGTFEYHVQQVERHLWGERFQAYDQWKRDYYEEYQRVGWFKTLSGFICNGYMTKKQVCNYPIQGTSFHMLLWSLIRLVNIELKKRNMLALIVCQIHDSIVADVPEDELDDFLRVCRKVMVKLIEKEFPFFIVPMEVEFSVAPAGGSWADKKDYKL